MFMPYEQEPRRACQNALSSVVSVSSNNRRIPHGVVESSLFFEAKLYALSERRELASTESGPVGKNVCSGLCWRVNDTALGSYKGRGPVTAGRHLVGNLELIRR